LINRGDCDRLHQAIPNRKGRDVWIFIERQMHDSALRRPHGLGHHLKPGLAHFIGELVGHIPQLPLAALAETSKVNVDHLAAATLLGDDPRHQVLERIEPFSVARHQLLIQTVSLNHDLDVVRTALRLHLSRQPDPLQDIRGYLPGEIEGISSHSRRFPGSPRSPGFNRSSHPPAQAYPSHRTAHQSTLTHGAEHLDRNLVAHPAPHDEAFANGLVYRLALRFDF
jgi:hypothetical protein